MFAAQCGASEVPFDTTMHRKSTAEQHQLGQLYQIGTVARLTGLSTQKIRMWEKRYGIVAPDRSQSRNRLYSQQDLERLKLIRLLVDSGHRISQIASLDKIALQQLLSQQGIEQGRPVAESLNYESVLVVSDNLTAADSQDISLDVPGAIDFVTHAEASDQLFAGSDSSEREDFTASVLVVDQASLHRDVALSWLQRIRTAQFPLAIIIYQFSDRDSLRLVTNPVTKAVKGPLTADLLERELLVVQSHYGASLVWKKADSPPRKFTRQELIRFARMNSFAHCECPKHLATLLLDLVNFEQYSKECESRNLADKAIHEYLCELAGNVRHQFEEALDKLVEMEQIPPLIK